MYYGYDDENIEKNEPEEIFEEESSFEEEAEEKLSETAIIEDIGKTVEDGIKGAVIEEPAEEETEETPADWQEPTYEAVDEKASGFYTPSYHVGSEEKKEKPKKKSAFWKVTAAVLAAVLLSSAACFGIANAVMDRRIKELENAPTKVVVDRTVNDKEDDGEEETTVSYTGKIMSAQDVYKLACPQVVGINVSVNTTNIFGQPTSAAVSGSGFIMSEDGYILTNYHVISYVELYEGELTVMFNEGESVPAKVIGYSADNDVAIIKVDKTGLNAVTLGDSDDMIVGEPVYAIGNPLGELTYTMTEGIVSALDRVITTTDQSTGKKQSINMFQTSAAINSGNSGGPVYNSRGEVIGIVTAKYSSSGIEGLGFAIPINDALNIATQLIETGQVTGAYLGVEVAATSDVYSSFAMQYYNYPSGVCIVKIYEGYCADKCGLLAGDIITKVGETEVTTTAELKLALKKFNPGDSAVLTVYRAGSTLGEGDYEEIDVVFDETPANLEEVKEANNKDSEKAPEEDKKPDDENDEIEEKPEDGTENGNGGFGGFFNPFGSWGGFFPFGNGNG